MKRKKYDIPDNELWPLAVMMRPTGGDWHLYAVAKGFSQAKKVMTIISEGW